MFLKRILCVSKYFILDTLYLIIRNMILVFAILILILILMLFSAMTAEAMSVFLDIDVDGSVANESYVPRCEKDKGIKVDLYEFLNRTCYPDSICLVEGRGELSILAVYNLYESCSMKHVCQNMSFPVVDIQAGGYNTVFVQYQCYGEYEYNCNSNRD